MTISATVMVLLAGCGDVVIQHGDHPDGPLPSAAALSASDSTPFAGLPSPPDAAAVAALRVVPLDGGPAVSVGSLLGRRATVVAFWQTTCATMATALQTQGVRVVLVDVYDSPGDARSYLAARGVSLPAFYDSGASAHDALRLLGVPTTAVLTGSGSVAARLEGSADNAGLVGQLASMGIST
jgi:hypothetical protein